MEHARLKERFKNWPGKKICPLVYAILFSFIIFLPTLSSKAFALPSGYSVESGNVSFDSSVENNLVINASDHAIINFDSFSIAQNEMVKFIQPFDTSSVLGRVIGNSETNIFGSLYANGQFIFINPNGINIHDTANIQVASLIASTLDIQNAMYLNNELTFEKKFQSNPGKIFNEADIAAKDGGHIVFLSEAIENHGALTARLGSVALGVGEKATVSFDSQGLINLVIDKGLSQGLQNGQAAIQNDGSLIADGGKIILTVKMLNDLFDSIVNLHGIVQANRAVEKEGQVYLVAKGGSIDMKGELRATNLTIGGDTVVNANDTSLYIERDWTNAGVFNGGTSTVEFLSLLTSHVLGNSEFYNFTSVTPGKTIIFEADTMTTISHTLTIKGGKGNFITLESSIPDNKHMFGIYINAVSDGEGHNYVDNITVKHSHAYGPVVPILTLHDYVPAELNIGWDATVTWDGGGGDGKWSTATNWSADAIPTSIDDVVFSATSNTTSNMDVDFTIKSLSMNSGYTSTVTLNGNLTTTGDATVNSGTLDLNGKNLTVVNLWAGGVGNILTSTGITTASGSIIPNGSGVGLGGTITTGAGGTIIAAIFDATYGIVIFNATAESTIQISGNVTPFGVTITAGLGKIKTTGTSSVNLYGNSIYKFEVASGTATLANNLTTTNALTVTGTLDVNGKVLTAGSLAGTGSGTVANTAAGAVTLAVGSDNTSTTFSGVISETSGAIALTKSGTGTLTLSGASTYTGLTTVSAGILQLGAAGGATNTPLGTVAAGTSITSGAALDLNGYTLGTAEALTLNGTGVSSGGALTNSSSTSATYSGLITLGSASSIVASSGNIVLSNTGTITGATYGLTLDGTSTASSLASVIGTTSGTVTKSGTGTWTLSGSNTYTGLTTIAAGILKLGAAGDATSGPLGTTGGATSITSGAALDLNGYTLGTAEALTLNGTGVSSGGALTNSSSTSATYSGLITLGSASSIVASSGNIVLSNTGTITGATYGLTLDGTSTASSLASVIGTTSGTVTKSGTGTWTLSGSNTYTGLTTVSAGTLKAGATLPFVGALTISGGIYDANDFATTVTGLTTVSSGSYLAKSSTQTLNGGLTVSGGTFTGLTGAVDINGNVSLTSGILTATSGAFTVSGNWAGGGTFTPGTGTIVFDGTNQSISNNNTFYGLTKTVSSADTFTLPASCTQTITNLIWQGTSSNKLSVVSSSGSVNATVAVSGTVTADNLIITLITASPGQTATNSSGTSATGWDFGTTPAAATVATTLNTGPVQDAISSSSVVTVGTLTTTSTTPSATVASSSAVALSNFGNAKATFWAPAPVGNGGFLLGTKSMEVKVGVLEGLVYVRMKKDNSLANVFGGEQLSVAKGQFKPSYQAVVANCATEVSKESPSVDQMTMRTGNLEKLSNSTVKFGQTVVPAGEQRITVENRGSVKISSIGNNLSDRVFSSRSLERILGDSQPLVAVSPNNNIAIVSDSGLVLFNQNTGSVKTVEMNGLPTAVTATRNGGAVITSNVDRTTQYVNANGMAKTLRLAVVPTKVVDVDGQRCVFTDGNNTVGIINYAKGTVGTKIHVENPRDIVMNPSDSNQVYVSQGNGIIQVFDLSNNRQIKMVKTIDTGVSNMGPMAIASNGSITVASRVNSLCKIIQPNGKMSEFSTPGPVTSLGFMGPDLHSITPVGIAGVISGAPKQAQPLVATKELASAPAQFASAGITKPVSMITPMPEQIFGGAMPVVKESIVPLQTSALVAPKASIATTQPTLKVEDIRVLPTPLPSDETIALVAPKASIATTQPTLKVEDIRVLPTPLPSDETIALVAPKASIATTQPTLKVEDIRVLPTPLPSDETIALVAPKLVPVSLAQKIQLSNFTPLPVENSVKVIYEKNGGQTVFIPAEKRTKNTIKKTSIDDPSQWQEVSKK